MPQRSIVPLSGALVHWHHVDSAMARPVSAMARERVIRALVAGERERTIAQREGISEVLVCRIRKAELDSLGRKVNACGVAFGTMSDTLRRSVASALSLFPAHVHTMHGDIDATKFEQLQDA